MTRETETRVARVFADVLEVRSVEADDDFFALGGDSFVAAQVALELERVFSVPIPTDVVEAVSTVRGIAAWIDDRQRASSASTSCGAAVPDP